jgi:hypothetical protein
MGKQQTHLPRSAASLNNSDLTTLKYMSLVLDEGTLSQQATGPTERNSRNGD